MEVEVKYDDIFGFVCLSESKEDYMERLQIISCVILDEVTRRVRNVIFPYQLVPIIDEMNEEVCGLVNKLNDLHLICDQPEIMNPLLLRLIQANHPKMFSDYIYTKSIRLN